MICLIVPSWSYSLLYSQILIPLCTGMLISSFSSFIFSNNYAQLKGIGFIFWTMTFMNVIFLAIVSALVYHSGFDPNSFELCLATTVVFFLTTIVSLCFKLLDFDEFRNLIKN